MEKRTGDNGPSIRNNIDLRDVSFILRNLSRSGHLAASEVLFEAGNMLESQRAELHAGAKEISHKGRSFTDAVSRIFPENILPAIRAGDESGNLDKVFGQIWEAAKAQEEINGVIGKLKGPVITLVVGIIMALIFLLGLVPFVYESMGRNAPQGYDPGFLVTFSVSARDWLLEWWVTVVVIALLSTAGIVMFFSKRENRLAFASKFVKIMSNFKGFGSAYSNLRFGVMARYLEIVSMAGLPMDRRISLVTEILPESLRIGMDVFAKEMMQRGIKDAALPNPRNPDDPRANPVYWPPYLRLAFAQSYETGLMDEPMREYGITMIDDGKERLQNYIGILNKLALALAGFVVMVPMGSIYSVMGEIMTMQLQKL